MVHGEFFVGWTSFSFFPFRCPFTLVFCCQWLHSLLQEQWENIVVDFDGCEVPNFPFLMIKVAGASCCCLRPRSFLLMHDEQVYFLL